MFVIIKLLLFITTNISSTITTVTNITAQSIIIIINTPVITNRPQNNRIQ